MTAYLKAVVAALAAGITALIGATVDGHITTIGVLVAAGAMLATFAATYFTPNSA